MEPYKFDIDLFLSLNGDCGNFIDQMMYIISHEYTWIPLYLVVLLCVIYRKGWKTGMVLLLLCVVAVGFADQTATQMKHFFPKLRPTHYPPLSGMVHTVNGYVGGLYCTVSSHAANSLAFVIISSFFVRKRMYTIVLSVWLLVVCYSRIYLGVHYPTDILLGLLDGTLYSFIVIFIYNKYIRSKLGLKFNTEGNDK